MSKKEKEFQRIIQMDKNLRFAEIKKVLEEMGYKAFFPRGGSSHCVFRKKGCYPISIPTPEPIKKKYVEMVRDLILREESV